MNDGLSHRIQIESYSASVDEVCDVWELMTINPLISIDEMADFLATSRSRINSMVTHLQNLGYVSRVYGKRNARKIHIPFVRRMNALGTIKNC